MIYKDSEGQEWEEMVDPKNQTTDAFRVIRPIKKPKWDTQVVLGSDKYSDSIFVQIQSPESLKKQAEAIKAFIEEGLKAIYEPKYRVDDLIAVTNETRRAIEEAE